MPPTYYDDVPVPGRNIGDPYAVRIGDCVFAIPPERISVSTQSNASPTHTLREKTNIITKSGYTTTQITMKLWFNSVEEINGMVLAAPDGSEYHMDGLRSLIAQFKRCPFLPIENSYLNESHNIWAVTLMSIAITTVPDFPNCMQAELTMMEFNAEPYINMHTALYGDMFCWPLFRWYYQQQLNGGKGNQLEPIRTKSLNGKFQFNIINEGYITDRKLEHILERLEPVAVSENLILTGVSIGMRNNMSFLQAQTTEQAVPQLMGAADTEILLDFMTTNENDVAILRNIEDHCETLARSFRNRVVAGFLRIDNELLQMAGIRHVMIANMNISTMEGLPGTYSIRMAIVDFDPLQRAQEAFNSFSAVKPDGSYDDLITLDPGDSNFIMHSNRVERMLGAMELYPDLELPGYRDVNQFIPVLNNWRINNKLTTIGIDSLQNPEGALFVDPDFYMYYPSPQDMVQLDLDDEFPQPRGLTPGQEKRITVKPENNDFANLYLLSFSGLTATQINDAINLRRRNPTRMTGTGVHFLRAEREVGINALFLVALAAQESGWGTHGFGNNIFGWGAFNHNERNANRYSKPTMSDTIVSIAAHIKRLYIDNGCVTPYLFQHSNFRRPYAQLRDRRPNPTWLKNISSIMSNIARTYNLTEFVKRSETAPQQPVDPEPEDTTGETITTISLENAGIIEYSDIGNAHELPRKQYIGEKLHERMCHDMVFYNKRGTMLRAYPSFVFLIVDQGEWMDGRRLWNNYYAYHAISEISVHKSRTNPVATAYIRMSNIYGNLTSRSQVVRSSAKNWWDRWLEIIIPTINDKMIRERNKLREDLSITAGARIHLRIGYGSAASTYPIQFNGRIAELSASDEFVAVCQSDGIEISNIVAAWGENSKNSIFNFGNEPSDILRTMFTRRRQLLTSYFGEASQFGIENFGFFNKKAEGVSGFLRALFSRNTEGYDLYKNIYHANSVDGNDPTGFGRVLANVGFEGEANLQMYLYGKSVWDVSQVLAQAVPGYIAYIHDHGLHSTFFYGRPPWIVKYAYVKIGDNPNNPGSYKEAVKPFQQIHVFRSDIDLIHNGVIADGSSLVTNAKATYSLNRTTHGSPVVYADRTIHPEYQRTVVLDSTTIHDTIIPTVFLEKAFAAIAGVVGARNIATNIAVSAIEQSFKAMYQGELIALGDPSIKPYDAVALLDTHTDMYGTVEVRDVVHSLSLETGFTTSVTPDLVVVQRNDYHKHGVFATIAQHTIVSTIMMMSYQKLHKIGINILTRAEEKAAKIAANIAARTATITRKATKTVAASKITVVRKLASSSKALAKTAIKQAKVADAKIKAAQALAKTTLKGIGAVKMFAFLAIWLVVDMVRDAIQNEFLHNNVIKIYPLSHRDRPYVAGTTGAKHLIPGLQSDMPLDVGNDPSTPKTRHTLPHGLFLGMPIDHEAEHIQQRITSHFGDTRKRTRPHVGVDFGGRRGEPIFASADGKIFGIVTDPDTFTGLAVTILHSNNIRTRYLHLDRIDVKTGQEVKSGQIIGTMGNTAKVEPGQRMGVHLHFDITVNNIFVDPVPLLRDRVLLFKPRTPSAPRTTDQH